MTLLVAESVREEERRAREELDRGCEADLLTVERFVRRPAAKAREELHAALLSLGTMEPNLRKGLMLEAAQETASRCARRAFSNANVRFRARFRIYAQALANAQSEANGRLRRRIAVPNLEPAEEPAFLPRVDASLATLDTWTAELRRLIAGSLGESVDAARRLVERRGRISMARGAIATRLRDPQR